MSTSSKVLEFSGVHKRYDGDGPWARLLTLGRANRAPVEALRGVDLVVERGEIVGLLGPNGSGKTTLLRLACGLVRASAGSVRCLGEDPSAPSSAVRARIGLVAREDRSFNLRLGGRQNLEFYAALRQLSGAQRRERVAEVLRQAGLESVADRPVGSYSSGMRQRLSIARALLAEPDVLLLDEATAGLDPGRRDAFYALINALAANAKTGVLHATHDLTEAQYFCTRVALLDGGRVVASGDYLRVEPAAEAVFRRESQEDRP